MNDTYDGAAPSTPTYDKTDFVHGKKSCTQCNFPATYFVPTSTPAQTSSHYQPKTYADDQLIPAFERWCRQVETAKTLSVVVSILGKRNNVIPINRSFKGN